MTGTTSDEKAAYRALIEGSETGTVRLPMLTGSMAPEILPGDLLVVELTPGRRVHLGDVAVFYARNRLTAHRILAAVSLAGRRWLLEKGDANTSARWVDDRRVLGRVSAVGRRGAEMPLPRGRAAAPALFRERWRLVYYSILRWRYRT